MNGRAGLASFLVVLATTFGLLVPVERGRGAAVRPAAVVDQKGRDTPRVAGKAAALAGPRRILGSDLVCQYVHGGRDASSQPSGQCDRDSSETRAVIAHVVIAILPDPLDSHLDWGFDAALESIQRAFERSGFVPDRYWLPWRPLADSGRGDTDAAAELRASAPGVMLFRKSSTGSDTLALVYFVGETPTRGIQTRAFRVALADFDTLNSRHASGWTLADGVHDTLRIVGPILSGSARSLRNAVADDYRGKHAEVLIISGGATAPSNRLLLRGCPGLMVADTAKCPGGRLRFFATVQPVDTLRAVMESVLCTKFGIGRGRIAYLKESNTQYAAGLLAGAFSTPNPNCSDDMLSARANSPLEIPFPINISRLRREYGRSATTSDTNAHGATLSRTRIDWRDPASSAESPPPLSELTAPIIERTLTDIEQTLVLHRIRAVGIVATDVRDRLFLAAAVKERFRDVKIFFIGSHALYLRPELNEYFRGALVVSTYPLFLENQFWDAAHPGDRERLVFTSDQSEGTYNATLIQLGHERDATDYGYPLGEETGTGRRAANAAKCGPPVWLTTVGAGSMMPLTAVRTGATTGRDDDGYLYRRDCAIGAGTASTEEPGAVADEGLFVGLLVLLFGVVFWFGTFEVWRRSGADRRAIMEFFRRRKPNATGSTGQSAVPNVARGAGYDQRLTGRYGFTERRRSVSDDVWQARSLALLMHHQSWLAFGFVAAVCTGSTLALILFRPQIHGVAPPIWLLGERSAAHVGIAFVILTFIVAAGLLVYVIQTDINRWREHHPRSTDHPPRLQRLGLLLVALLYLTFTAIWIGQVVFFKPAPSAMYFLRALQLNSGVTPAVPALLGGVILFVWSVAHLRRVSRLAITSAFEEACVSRGVDASFVPPELHGTPARGIESIRPQEEDIRRASALQLGTAFNLRRWVAAVRSSLFDLVPRLATDPLQTGNPGRPARRLGAFVFAGALVLFWLWLLFTQIDRTNEVLALGPLFVGRFLSVPSSFDLLFRFLIVCSVTLSAWTLYRLVTTWSALRNCLRNIDVMPIGRGFERLPKSIATLARFSPFAPAEASALRYELDRAAYQRWHWLRGKAPDAVEHVSDPPVLRTNQQFAAEDIAEPFMQLYSALSSRVLQEPGLLSVSEEPPHRSAVGETEQDQIMTLQELIALYVIDYVAWTLRHVRDLATYLLISLTLTTALLSSYPFEPASLLKVTFFAMMAMSVVQIGSVLVQVNRNATLSRIAHTTPGEVNWDLRFVVNLLVIAGVPLLTVLAAQFPEVRDFLFAWVTPIVKALGKV